MKYIVTGGAGFIGSHICSQLSEAGHEIKVIDNLSSGSQSNIKDIKNLRFVKLDVTDYSKLEKEFSEYDYVIHLAALVSVQESIKDPKKAHDISVNGTHNALLAAKKNNIKKFVFASSAAVYGNTKTTPISEDFALNPESPYALHKIVGEQYCRLFNRLYGMDTVSLRFFNVYGPRQSKNSTYAAAIPTFITKMIDRERPTIFGDGLQSRDFIYVEDVADAVINVCNSKETTGAYNIATGKPTTILEIIQHINSALSTDIRPIHKDARKGDIKHSCATIRLGKRYIGKTTSLSTGLKKTINWYKEVEK